MIYCTQFQQNARMKYRDFFQLQIFRADPLADLPAKRDRILINHTFIAGEKRNALFIRNVKVNLSSLSKTFKHILKSNGSFEITQDRKHYKPIK